MEAVAEGGSAQGVGFWSLDGSEQDQADMSVRPTWNGVRFWGLVGAEAPHFLAGFTGLKPGATVPEREDRMVEIESEWTAHDREMLASGGPQRLFLGPEPALSLP